MARQAGASSFVAIPLSVLAAEASLPLVEVGRTPEGEPILEPAVQVGKAWWEKLQIAKLRSGKIYTLQPAAIVAASPTAPSEKEEEDDHQVEFTISEPK
jgi:hypothetical protein